MSAPEHDPEREAKKKSLERMRRAAERVPPTSFDVKMMLRDPEYQKGPAYRANKITAIREGLRQGMTIPEILDELVDSGLTVQKAREIFRTATRRRGMLTLGTEENNGHD